LIFIKDQYAIDNVWLYVNLLNERITGYRVGTVLVRLSEKVSRLRFSM
jgi:hypothetical protein